MHRLTSCLLLAGVLAVASAARSASQPICRPALTLERSAHFDVLNQQRRWTGVVAVDTARCATAAGAFAIEFVRHKENAPESAFTEWFTWTPGHTVVALDVWRDEWVDSNRIVEIAPCPCRE
jgi:hypothetical protein